MCMQRLKLQCCEEVEDFTVHVQCTLQQLSSVHGMCAMAAANITSQTDTVLIQLLHLNVQVTAKSLELNNSLQHSKFYALLK